MSQPGSALETRAAETSAGSDPSIRGSGAMRTRKQVLGDFGEKLVCGRCRCPRCKRYRTLRLLPPGFKCADLICDFCGFLGQVKTCTVQCLDGLPQSLPRKLLGAAWEPQKQRMDSAIYFPLFLVVATADLGASAIYYLSADLQPPELFLPRKPLSEAAKRAGWRGFLYDLDAVKGRLVRLA